MMTSRFTIALIGLVASLLIAQAAPSAGQGTVTVRFGWDANAQGAPMVLMKELAAKDGVNVELHEFQRYPEIRTALAAGSLDMGGPVDPNGMVLMASQGVTNLVTVMDLSVGGDAIVIRKGVDVKQLSDLKGKTVGVGEGGIGWVAFINLLQDKGIAYNQIKAVNFSTPTDLANALKKQQVDAIQIWQPFIAQLVDGGYGYVTPGVNLEDSSILGDLNGVVASSKSFAAAHPDVVVKVVRAILQAGQTVQKDHALWVKTIQGFASGMSDETLQHAIATIKFPTSLSVRRLDGLAKLLYQVGIAKTDMSGKLGAFVDVSYLQKATGRSVAELEKK